jgi:hypothetical protein
MTQQTDNCLCIDMSKESNNSLIIRTVGLYHIGTAHLHNFLENFLMMVQFNIDI